MAGTYGIGAFIERYIRQFSTRWWGGVRCRVSFYVSLALFLAAAFFTIFFFIESDRLLKAEMRGRALAFARHLATMLLPDIAAERAGELDRKINPAFISFDGGAADPDLRTLAVYDRSGRFLVGRTRQEAPHRAVRVPQTGPAEAESLQASLTAETRQMQEPLFRRAAAGIYEVILPVRTGGEVIGFVRLGLSGEWHAARYTANARKAAVILVIIVLIGLAISRAIAVSITKPLSELSAAADELKRRNWSAPVPVQGRGEISRLIETFNDMAQTLLQREISLSRGNRDLFILHTAGLDLMEGLDIDALLQKTAARAEDLVRADTVALATVDQADREMKYASVSGGKATALAGLERAIEAGGIYNWIASYGTPLLIQDAQSDFRLNGELMASLGIRSLMTVPLWSSNTMTGLLTAFNKKGGGAFDKHDLRLFTVFSNLVSSALQNASLYNDLKTNMDELEEAQGQFVRAAKMAAIGELAANVAHEVNNPLTSVLGYTTHLIKTLDLPEQQKSMLQMIEQETLRVRKIIRGLLDFSSQRSSWRRPADLLQPLRETVALLQGVAESGGVRIFEEYDGAPVVAYMNENEMKQVFINIATNALQAMPGGGDLRIRVRSAGRNEAHVEFADSGVGIAEEHRARIFEPFFSTKTEGGGTGLGLSISYRIVQNHGGRIEVESAPGSGSVFRVILPLVRQDAAARAGAG
ncbi:MAG: hypothetical protein A2X56_01080 [Nitrospirae bacterium GWC2_57_13]|jgi:signal transduction histidine kinase/HAMP domain-containing protein|nr:MAG: hypothetical protein A2072_06290 [Nitrospirae bacterium GWC1_57_7]OGW28849.1 MAG: hypothetical protein A2X56_01080 [Nitrospirae bacterium GWC2_57_13]